MKKIMITILLVGLFLSLNSLALADYKNKEYTNQNLNNEIKQLIPRIKLGFIAVTTDGTRSGSSVIVDANDWNLRDYYSRTVNFYIDYSIVNGGENDYVKIDVNITKNNSHWDQTSSKISNDYVIGEILFENIQIIQGDVYDVHIKATYINENPSFVIWDEDVSSLALTKFNLFRFINLLSSLLSL